MLLGCALGVAVQVGDRLLVALAMRSRPRDEDTVDRSQVVAVTSAFYLRPAAGSVVAFAANRLGRDRRRGSVVPVTATGLVRAAFALRAWSLRVLGEFYSPVVEVRPNHRVVTDGPYRLVRHPGYLAGLMQSIGVGMAFSNPVRCGKRGRVVAQCLPAAHPGRGGGIGLSTRRRLPRLLRSSGPITPRYLVTLARHSRWARLALGEADRDRHCVLHCPNAHATISGNSSRQNASPCDPTRSVMTTSAPAPPSTCGQRDAFSWKNGSSVPATRYVRGSEPGIMSGGR